MKRYEKIKLLERKLLDLKDSFQLHKADLDGWDLRMEKATLDFQAKQLEYNTTATRKQTLLENISENMDQINKRLEHLKKKQKEDVINANERKKTPTKKKRSQAKEEEKPIAEKVIQAKKEFIEKVAKMEDVPEEKAEPSKPQELTPPPPEGWETIDIPDASGTIQFEAKISEDGTYEYKADTMSLDDLEKELDTLVPPEETIEDISKEASKELPAEPQKDEVLDAQIQLREALVDAKAQLNDNIGELESIDQAWIDEYKNETGKNAIWNGKITKQFKDFCKEVLGVII